MNKTEMVAAIAERAEISRKDAERALAAFIEETVRALKKGDKVQLVGFGSFEVKERAERKGRNPQTKMEMVIPASKVPVFKAGKAFKDEIDR
ncbi:MAG: HU family DNA-binding protein [Clostridia bacterium]|nr:HU family DNA-binding protein [Clostridia bacterium]